MAMGEEPDEQDVDEARERARADNTPAWVQVVAGKISGTAPAEPEEEPKPMSEMERRLRRRLGMPVDDGTDDAA
jgi:hypothetical protein